MNCRVTPWARCRRIICARLTRRSTAMASQRIEKRHQLVFLSLGQYHLKPQIVKIDQFMQVSRGAVVKKGCACRQGTEDGPLDAIEIGTIARYERLAWIGGVEGFGLATAEGIRAAG